MSMIQMRELNTIGQEKQKRKQIFSDGAVSTTSVYLFIPKPSQRKGRSMCGEIKQHRGPSEYARYNEMHAAVRSYIYTYAICRRCRQMRSVNRGRGIFSVPLCVNCVCVKAKPRTGLPPCLALDPISRVSQWAPCRRPSSRHHLHAQKRSAPIPSSLTRSRSQGVDPFAEFALPQVSRASFL